MEKVKALGLIDVMLESQSYKIVAKERRTDSERSRNKIINIASKINNIRI